MKTSPEDVVMALNKNLIAEWNYEFTKQGSLWGPPEHLTLHILEAMGFGHSIDVLKLYRYNADKLFWAASGKYQHLAQKVEDYILQFSSEADFRRGVMEGLYRSFCEFHGFHSDIESDPTS